MAKYSIPRIVIGGVSSGSGKTMFSIGLMQALKNRGMEVAPFKVGPDYIDPMYHNAATEKKSRNLDGFMMSTLSILESFAIGCDNADIAVIEGVMGLFDSHDGVEERGSTAQVAKILESPVILIADVTKIARSAAALVNGFKTFDPELKVAGVVLNKTGSERHKDKVTRAVEKFTNLEVVGAIPKDPSLHVPERHLGLFPAHEVDKDIESLASIIEANINLKRVVEIAESTVKITRPEKKESGRKSTEKKVGILYDDAFRFYYPETLRQLSESATPVFIDAIKDRTLSAVDVLYIGGGFPEVFTSELEKNDSLRNEIYDFCASGNKVYGECGGLMYLGETIITKEGEFEMVGFLPLTTEMQDGYVGMGYVENLVLRNNPLSRKGERIIGHEFHHSRVTLKEKVDFVYKTMRGRGIDGQHDGVVKNNVLASYMHIHPLGYRNMIKNLLKK
jgi:cobyrinic acid a,c-diamide synthase